MLGQKRKYDEEDKKKAKEYYLMNKDVIKERNKKYREGSKDRPVSYAKNPNTKKAKMLKNRIDKVNKEIENLKKNDKKDLSFGLPQPKCEIAEQKISIELEKRINRLEEKKNYFHYCRGEEKELLREEIREEEILIKDILNNKGCGLSCRISQLTQEVLICGNHYNKLGDVFLCNDCLKIEELQNGY